MSSNMKEFTPDTHVKKSYIGKAVSSVIFFILGFLMAYAIFQQYQKLMIPGLIMLAVGVILLTIWNDKLYIYRYLMPAIIIISVFTIYPIGYTVFIAFTNYGTGHMRVKDDARNELLKGKWVIDYEESPIYAEFFLSEKDIKDFNKAWYDSKLRYIQQIEKAKENYAAQLKRAGQSADDIYEDDIPEVAALKDRWYDIGQPEVIDRVLSKFDIDDFTVLAYNTDKVKVLVDEDGSIVNIESSNDESPVVYFGKYVKTSKGVEAFELKEISFDEIDEYVSGKVLISDKVRNTELFVSADDEDDFEYSSSYYDDDLEDPFYAKEHSLSIRDFISLSDKLKEETPLALTTESGVRKEFLNSIGNEFMRKMREFSIIDGELYMLTSVGNGEYEYTTRVYEDSYQGAFVVTKDGSPVKYWKEYSLSGISYDYGIFAVSNNSEIEGFLNNIANKDGLTAKISQINRNLIEGTPLDSVSSANLTTVRNQINDVNKQVKEFNRKRRENQKIFFEMKTAEHDKINARVNEIIKSLSDEAVQLRKDLRENKKLPKTYKTVKEAREINIRLDLIRSQIRQQNKEIRGRKAQLKDVNLPKLKNIKLEVITNSNVNYEHNIEPGYVTTIGLRNFSKIFTTRNITAPFMRVFVWTVLWAFFSVITQFAVGLMLALVFNAGDLKGRIIYRTLFILPYAIPFFVSVLMWRGFLNDEFGVINLALGLDIPWLFEPSGIMPKISVLLVNLWLGFPYMMIISLGALQSIDDSMYEAADVDGASKFQQFWGITLPLLLMALGPMLVGSFAFAFNNFAGIYLLTSGGPVMASGVLPGHTDILISYTYKLAFGHTQTDYGLASAVGIIVFFIIGSITFFNFKYTGTFKEVDNA